MTYKCKSDVLTSSLAAIILLTAFVCCTRLGGELTHVLRAVCFAAGTLFFAAALYVAARHLIYRYVYVLEADALKVYRIVGKNSTLCANVPMYETLSLEKKKTKSVRIYSYTQNIFPENARFLLCSGAGGKYALKLEADDKFCTMLLAFMPSKKV